MHKFSTFFNFNSSKFEEIALEIFQFQAKNCSIYSTYLKHLKIHIPDIKAVTDIPFLPIHFFKTSKIISSEEKIEKIFSSSGTTGNSKSKHFITDISIYKDSFRKGFEHFYGNIEDYTILALLPMYLERDDSSLIFMVNDLISKSKKEKSGFYLDNYNELNEVLIELDNKGEKVLLIGVSFALLNFVEKYNLQLKNTIIMETGGMKGQRKELIREELHSILCNGFGVEKIHSEYGMTELLSQAYSQGNGIFKCNPWMKVLIRDINDPFTNLSHKKTGGINIIDFANINSCSFIATQDLGKTHANETFEILGRFDNSDIRGCNLLIL